MCKYIPISESDQTNRAIKAITSAKIAIASVNAIPMNIVACNCPDASGLRPIASSARPTIIPIPIAGPNAPSPIASAIESTCTDSCSICLL